ncbi:MAG: PHB depolymerase family esterase [Bacteriovoracaceae bacterium]|nr:PHB depolymerase family esterase [Bacteriovoracaceae bacterium]
MTKTALIALLIFSQYAWAEKVTVSGISAGAYMAQQFHLAFSSEVSGVGMIAGGPFYCSGGGVMQALKGCMETERGLPLVEDSLGEAQKLARAKKIDQLKNLLGAKIYVLQGSNDPVVDPRIANITVESYQRLGVSQTNIIFENKLPSGHAYPTMDFGNSCETASETPFISACKRDVAGEILNHLIGNLRPKKSPRRDRLFSFNQTVFFNPFDSYRLSMHDAGLVYVPQDCSINGSQKCRIHVSFHGCMQTLEDIQITYATSIGYNSWAEANKIIVVYPQAKRNYLIGNPYGCWDWWGYSSNDFHNKNGPQIKVVAKIVEALQGGKLQLTEVKFKD